MFAPDRLRVPVPCLITPSDVSVPVITPAYVVLLLSPPTVSVFTLPLPKFTLPPAVPASEPIVSLLLNSPKLPPLTLTDAASEIWLLVNNANTPPLITTAPGMEVTPAVRAATIAPAFTVVVPV